MFKKILILVLLCFVIYYYKTKQTPNVIPKPDPIPAPIVPVELTYEQVLNLINKQDLKSFIEKLSSEEFAGRGTGSKGIELSQKYIEEYLKNLDIPYENQSFDARGKNATNIIANVSPKQISSNKVIVIGAHYDHLGQRGSSYFPGADDNASGTAGVMMIAKCVKKYSHKLNHTILLHFYSAEEMGLLGSKFYVNNPTYPKNQPNIEDHLAMINLDMIGYLKERYNTFDNTTSYRDETNLIDHITSTLDLKNIVNELSSKYKFANNICGYKPGGSDHAPFYHKGIPVVFMHTGTHPHYHKPSDTPEKLNYTGLENCVKLAFEILIKVDQNEK